jgi:putative ABC transport system permease protein
VFLSLGEGMRQAFAQELGGVGPDLQVSFGDFDANAFGASPSCPIGYVALPPTPSATASPRVCRCSSTSAAGSRPDVAVVFQGLPPDSRRRLDLRRLRGRRGPRRSAADDEGAMVAVVGPAGGGARRPRARRRPAPQPARLASRSSASPSAGGLLDNTVLVPLEQPAGGDRHRGPGVVPGARARRAGAAAPSPTIARLPGARGADPGDLLSVVERGLAISDVVRLGISAIALIVGAIAVANTMLMSVFERTREFGVVRAVGARPRFLFGLVLVESVALSLVGAAVGVVLGSAARRSSTWSPTT